jgi:hypothetical protein
MRWQAAYIIKAYRDLSRPLASRPGCPSVILVAEGTMRANKHITPIDMEIIYRAHRSVWAALKQDKLLGSSDETHELSDKVTRTLVEFAREGVIDLETLRERTLAEIMRS